MERKKNMTQWERNALEVAETYGATAFAQSARILIWTNDGGRRSCAFSRAPPKFDYTTAPAFLSSEICEKTAQTFS